MGDKGITFDKNYQIRVLDPDNYEEARKLKENCTDFLRSMNFGIISLTVVRK
jgi:hypothetical protein